MPSTKPRTTAKPTLKQRAATLATAAAKVMRRKPGQPAPAPTLRPDPIFSAIEAHRAAFNEWDRLDRETETLLPTNDRYKAILPACNQAEAREIELFSALLDTRATTAEGLRSLIVYLPKAAQNTAPATAGCDQQRALDCQTAWNIDPGSASKIDPPAAGGVTSLVSPAKPVGVAQPG